ncbi:MAG: DNA repair protein RecN [Ginsengibacter sp.]
MLQQLQINNYAIIDSIEINFSNHLNIITGETGAGKSILMGALSLILGDRADTSVLLDKQKKCIIEGTFKTDSLSVKNFFEKSELDYETDIFIRREISASGKSRAFINDTPVTLQQLKQLSSLLVDLHQQFDTLELNRSDFQREVIDALGDNFKLVEDYQLVYKNYKSTLAELQKLSLAQVTANKEYDYNQFLFTELEEANFREGEIEKLDIDIRVLSNTENIKTALTELYNQLEEGEDPVNSQMKIIQSRIHSLQQIFPETNSLHERIKSVEIELKDIADEISTLNDKVIYDEQKITELNDRMAVGYNLLKKHNVSDTAQLITIKNELQKKLDEVTNLTEAVSQTEKKSQKYYSEALELAGKISAKRLKVIDSFEDKVNKLLAQVGMPNAHLKVQLNELEELNQFGKNSIDFLFNANKTSRFEPLRKVASGGELSRIMLIIKSLVAKSVHLPTLIFDEIDSGISGEAARQVGIIIKQLSMEHQLISITHQPQIAAKASTHFFVFKEMKNNQIVTSIKVLNKEEKVAAIATMLSGMKPTAAAFENAREMMEE